MNLRKIPRIFVGVLLEFSSEIFEKGFTQRLGTKRQNPSNWLLIDPNLRNRKATRKDTIFTELYLKVVPPKEQLLWQAEIAQALRNVPHQ